MLEKRGTVLDTARTVSRLLRDHNVKGAVIGGIAVVLHGHVRTTKDVDVLVRQPTEDFSRVLTAAGASFDPARREFTLDGVPIHLVPESMAVPSPGEPIELDGVTTLTLPDLINLKLRSGIKNLARAQDIADVVGLIRHHRLTTAFASQIDKPLRAEFRKLVKAVGQN